MKQPDELIARFLQVSTEVEQYLHTGGPLTPLQYQTLTTTIMSLQTFIQSWASEHPAE